MGLVEVGIEVILGHLGPSWLQLGDFREDLLVGVHAGSGIFAVLAVIDDVSGECFLEKQFILVGRTFCEPFRDPPLLSCLGWHLYKYEIK